MINCIHGQLIETAIEITLHDTWIVQLNHKGNKNHVFIYQIQDDFGWFDVGKGHNHWNIHRNDPVTILSIYDIHVKL